MALVTSEDLINYMSGISLNEYQTSVAENTLASVQQDLELYLNRKLELIHVREKVQSNERGELRLTQSPIYKILSIKPINGTLVVPTVITPEPLTDTVETHGLPVMDLQPMQNNIIPGGVYIGKMWQWNIIEYIAGGSISNYLFALKDAIMKVASRDIMYNHDDTLSLKGGFADQPTDDAPKIPKGWQEDELKKFDRLRRRTIV